jgi:drug/metabolite transporter (DMT)-like permease
VAGAHGIGLVALALAALVIRPPFPGMGGIALGLTAGVAGAVGLAALYRGMSMGSMGLVTALAGAASLVIPLVASAATGATIGPLQLAGVVAAAAAAAAGGGASRGDMGRQALLLAGVAAIGFGAWYVLVDLAARNGDPLWALVFSRASSSILTGVVAIGRVDRARFPVRIVAAAGLFDVGGNVLFVIARDSLPVGLAAALTGMYPVVTMILARVVLGERLSRLGLLGVALALLGVVLISIGAPAAQ